VTDGGKDAEKDARKAITMNTAEMGVSGVREVSEHIPASLEALEALCLRLRTLFAESLDDAELFAVELLLRELLTNAVCHGCAGDPRCEVRCLVRLAPGTLSIAVEDDGKGFDWRAALARPPDPTGTSGRGMAILRFYATDLHFNEAGNRVELVRELRQQRSP
jgi:serine/threonine-protein kinase RsbW/non-specific serine/threonine protein kinase